MAGERGPQETTVPASADLSAFQYRAVHLRSDGSAGTFAEVHQVSNGSTPPFGVLTNKPGASSRGARVAYRGMTKLEAGIAIAIGDFVGITGGGGRGTPVTMTAAGTCWIL